MSDGRGAPPSVAIDHSAAASRLVALKAGDQLTLSVYQDSGVGLNLKFVGSSNETNTELWALKACGCGTPIDPVFGG